MSATPIELARVAAAAADEKKATEICLIDLARVTDVADCFLIATANNRRLLDVVVEEIEEKVRINCDEKPLSIEGRANGNWVVMDYGAVVIHVFLPETRGFYRLERLWGDAPRVSLGLEGEMDEASFAAANEVDPDEEAYLESLKD